MVARSNSQISREFRMVAEKFLYPHVGKISSVRFSENSPGVPTSIFCRKCDPLPRSRAPRPRVVSDLLLPVALVPVVQQVLDREFGVFGDLSL
jgi:hypothetical protein